MSRRCKVADTPPPDLMELSELPPDPGPAWPEPPPEVMVPPPPPREVGGWVIGGDAGLDDLVAELFEEAEHDPTGKSFDLDRLMAEAWWDRDEAERALLGTNPPAWATAPAGPELAAELDRVRLATASPVTLIELMKAAARMQAWAEATTAAAMAAFWSLRRTEAAARAADDDPHYGTEEAKADPMRGAAAEIAAALRLSPRSVGGQIADAVRLSEVLPETFAALRSGRITMTKARVILDGTEHVDPATQRAVQQRVLGRAGNQTRPQLGAAVRRALAAIDPDGENERHRRARRNREVTIRPLADGMAELSWVDSADVIQTAWIALNCLADAAKRTATDPTGTTDSRDDVDPTDPTDSGKDADPDLRTADQRRCDAAGDLFRVLLDQGADWLGRPFASQHRRRPHIEVLIPITVLLGIREDVCELAGYGPIPSDMARRIATEGTWRRLLTDPGTGPVLEAATTRHDPPAHVSETLLARDQTCRWFGCRMPARLSDRDHVTKFRRSGSTRLADLLMFCEFHHRIKDDDTSGWTTDVAPDGTLDQSSPTGHRYQTRPPGPGPISGPVAERDPDPPPF